MRNLKRALSLTLASVMLLGMMVVGSSAKGYDDVDEKNNIEAIEVLQAIEVMVGDERGFGPDRPVNRAEMAVVMGKLLSLDYDYYATSCPFNDVYDWARGWVGAAYANKIVSGRGEGVYDPGSTVTAVEAASMLMRALGYFQYANDTADGFELSTVRQGTKIGIFDGVGSSATAPMTRNQVAKMVLNALQSDVVEPDGNTINLTTPDGTVLTGKVNYVSVTRDEPYAWAIDDTRATSVGSNNDGWIVELGERLYNGELKLFDDRTDDFGRPSRTWEYKGKAIGTYMKKELLKQEWTVEVTGKDLYDLLGSDTIKDYDFDIIIDGVDVGGKTGTNEHDKVLKDANKAASYFDENDMTKTNKAGVGKTGKGVLTQVFVDPDEGKDGKVWVAVINTYLAKATTDYSEKKDEAKLDVYALAKDGTKGNEVFYKYPAAVANDKTEKENRAVASDDFAAAADIKKDDFFLVTVANGEIESLVKPEVLSAVTASKFSLKSYVVSGGTQYDYNTTIEYDPEVLDKYTGVGETQQLKDTEYNLYLDPYGYLIGVDVVEAVKNYIFLTGIDQGTSNLKNKTAEAAGILMDGTFVEFKMNLDKSKAWSSNHTFTNTVTDAQGNIIGAKISFTGHPLWNTWCTYTVDNDGTYTLTEVRNTINTDKDKGDIVKVAQTHDTDYMGKTIDHKHVSLVGGAGYNYVYGNDNTVYIVPEIKAIATDTELDQNTVDVPKHGSSDILAPDAADLEVGGTVGIVAGVDSVTTGIDNMDMTTWTLAQIQAADGNKLTGNVVVPGNVYTLYNKDGYVIAAVVVGEDNGATKNLVYSHKSSIESEEYLGDNKWEWTRKVIKDGVETLLTQTGDKANPENSIYTMGENVWYEVNLKADGTVKEVKTAWYTNTGRNPGTTVATGSSDPKGPALAETTAHTQTSVTPSNANFVDDIIDLEETVANSSKDTVLYEQAWTVEKAPSLDGKTLYVDTANKKGFYVKEDVKTALIQNSNGKWDTTYYENVDELEDVLENLNKSEDGEYQFKISAVMTGGRASVVVIHDWVIDAVQKGDKDKTETKGNHPTDHFVDMLTGGDKVLEYYDSSDDQTVRGAVSNITKWLTAEGYTVNGNPVLDGGVYTWSVTKDGIDEEFTWNGSDGLLQSAPTVTLDGKKVTFSGKYSALLTALGTKGTAANSGSYYLRQEDSNGDLTKYALQNDASASGATVTDGDVVTTGYKKLTLNGSNVSTASFDVSASAGFEAYSSAYYAPAKTQVKKGTTDAADDAISGFEVGAAGKFLPYGTTLETIDAASNDGTVNGTADVKAISKICLTINYADGTAQKKIAIAKGADIASETNVAASGSGWNLGDGNGVVAIATKNVNADTAVTVGYIKLKGLTSTITALTDTNIVWTYGGTAIPSGAEAAGAYVVKGKNLVGTFTTGTTGITTGTSDKAVGTFPTSGTYNATTAYKTGAAAATTAPDYGTTTANKLTFKAEGGAATNYHSGVFTLTWSNVANDFDLGTIS